MIPREVLEGAWQAAAQGTSYVDEWGRDNLEAGIEYALRAMLPTTLYVAQRSCGDYYCGCGGGHIVGVFTTEDAALKAADGEKVTAIETDVAKGKEPEGWGYGFDGGWT